MIPEWAREYVGLPFRARGRDRSGLDCWGLVRLVLAERYGLDLPAFSDGYEDHRDLGLLACIVDAGTALVAAEKISEPDAGAVVVLRVRGAPCHVGLCLGGQDFLHVEYGKDSILDRLDSPRNRIRIEGFYRVG